jgi:hypothetical protein
MFTDLDIDGIAIAACDVHVDGSLIYDLSVACARRNLKYTPTKVAREFIHRKSCP